MPYKSEAQRRFFHTDTARRKGITAEMVKEYDSASKGKKLTKRKKPKKA
jgi:hypothetical protein